MELAEALGIVVRERRMAMGMSQATLAKQANLHRNFIVLLEGGKTSAAVDSVDAVASALLCRPSQLLAAAERVMDDR